MSLSRSLTCFYLRLSVLYCRSMNRYAPGVRGHDRATYEAQIFPEEHPDQRLAVSRWATQHYECFLWAVTNRWQWIFCHFRDSSSNARSTASSHPWPTGAAPTAPTFLSSQPWPTWHVGKTELPSPQQGWICWEESQCSRTRWVYSKNTYHS